MRTALLRACSPCLLRILQPVCIQNTSCHKVTLLSKGMS